MVLVFEFSWLPVLVGVVCLILSVVDYCCFCVVDRLGFFVV